jgi:hypothetical protein
LMVRVGLHENYCRGAMIMSVVSDIEMSPSARMHG